MINLRANALLNYSLNLGIRGFTIGLKFLFALFLGRFYSDEILGEYGLFSTTVAFSFIILSLSFESYALREIIQKPKEYHLTYIRNLFLFFIISFLVFTPFFLIIFNNGLISTKLIFYFLSILFLETLCQVFFALLTILQKPVAANLILFFNQGSWIVVTFSIWFLKSEILVSIQDFLSIWILGGFVAAAYGFFFIRKLYLNSILYSVDWQWIRAGLSISIFFFCSALGYKVIEFGDRYFIGSILGNAKLGVYTFYGQIANLINTVINVTVVLLLYPKLMESYVSKDMDAFLSIKRKMTERVILIGFVLSIFAILFVQLSLAYIGKESFYQEIHVFYILLLSNLVMNLSFIPHYCLYAMKRDRILFYTTIIGSIASIIMNYALIPRFGIKGAALATFTSFVLIWVLKSFHTTNKKINYKY